MQKKFGKSIKDGDLEPIPIARKADILGQKPGSLGDMDPFTLELLTKVSSYEA